ncbi:hypothetical protein [Streptococcus equi]
MGVIGTIYGYALQKTGHDVEHVVRIVIRKVFRLA